MSETLNKDYQSLCDEGRIKFITFHPSYSYEEFIEGISVRLKEKTEDGGQTEYVLKHGVFKEICKQALGAAMKLTREELDKRTWNDVYKIYCARKPVDFNFAKKFVLIIDEINRGDIAKIFGELITLLEADKRLGEENEILVDLPVSGDQFAVPPNLIVIGTMNTADRSIALLDVALRRRFGFIEMNPNFGILRTEHLEKKEDILKENGVYDLLEKSITAIETINGRICKDSTIGRDRQIGHAFLFRVKNVNDLVMVWRYELLPLLEEYCYQEYAKINRMLYGKYTDSEWITEAGGIQDLNRSNIGSMLESIK